MKKEDVIQSVLQGIMSGGPSAKMKKKARDVEKKRMTKEEEEILEDIPTVVEISVMEPVGVEKLDEDEVPMSIKDKLKKKAMSKK